MSYQHLAIVQLIIQKTWFRWIYRMFELLKGSWQKATPLGDHMTRLKLDACQDNNAIVIGIAVFQYAKCSTCCSLRLVGSIIIWPHLMFTSVNSIPNLTKSINRSSHSHCHNLPTHFHPP